MRLATRSSTAVHNNAVIRVYDEAGNVIDRHAQAHDFKAEQKATTMPPTMSRFLTGGGIRSLN